MLTSTNLTLKGLLKYLNMPGQVYQNYTDSKFVVDLDNEVVPVYLEYRNLLTIDSITNTLLQEKFLFDTFKGKTGVIWG
jgi:sulfur carrier protein ThiS